MLIIVEARWWLNMCVSYYSAYFSVFNIFHNKNEKQSLQFLIYKLYIFLILKYTAFISQKFKFLYD